MNYNFLVYVFFRQRRDAVVTVNGGTPSLQPTAGRRRYNEASILFRYWMPSENFSSGATFARKSSIVIYPL